MPIALQKPYTHRKHPPGWRKYGQAQRERWESREAARKARWLVRRRKMYRAWSAKRREAARAWRANWKRRRQTFIERQMDKLYAEPVVQRALAEPVLFRGNRLGWACRIRRDDLPLYVRKVKGGAYQSRPWIGPGQADNVNLGLFKPADYDGDRDMAIDRAHRAATAFLSLLARRPGGGLGADADLTAVWEVIQELQRMEHRPRRGDDGRVRWVLEPVRPGYKPVVPLSVLPPRVYRISGPDGTTLFGARLKRQGEVIADVGPFADPGMAYAAIEEVRRRMRAGETPGSRWAVGSGR